MPENINTTDYWDNRFSTGNWEEKQGRWQTRNLAKAQISHLNIKPDFNGTLVDFGCALGDALPQYKEYFPLAKLIGMDISQSAIDKCRSRYGLIADFAQGDHTNVPVADVIVASHVVEHLTDDITVVKDLFSKCQDLFIIVPYKESPLLTEHIRAYDETSFSEIDPYEYRVLPYYSGITRYTISSLYEFQFKNIFRIILGKRLHQQKLQIIFHFKRKAETN